ncbi:hypothetical protein AX15_007850 [Amanita polypyramis BW_CC]|nr:hypothetical protein AX15_007850 [Amanita polypyramis BW_CC]
MVLDVFISIHRVFDKTKTSEVVRCNVAGFMPGIVFKKFPGFQLSYLEQILFKSFNCWDDILFNVITDELVKEVNNELLEIGAGSGSMIPYESGYVRQSL